jgi:hypothetical protein
MAISNSMPQGKWLKGKKTEYWLRFKRFHMFEDASGSDHIALQKDLRKAMEEATAILDQHKISIANIYSDSFLDSRTYDRIYGIAIGFENKEDYVMAKLVLKCDEFV